MQNTALFIPLIKIPDDKNVIDSSSFIENSYRNFTQLTERGDPDNPIIQSKRSFNEYTEPNL